jgi:energy-coupling factor transport system permease protein
MNPYLFIDENTFFHRLDPRTKLFLLISIFVIATMQVALVGSISIFLLVIFQATISRSLSNIKRIWFILILVFMLSTILWSLHLDGKTQFFWKFELEPFIYGLSTGIKLDAMLIAGLIFLSTTRNEEISLALIKLRIPYRLTFASTTALRLVPTFIGTAMNVANAQKTRGLELDKGNPIKRMRCYFPLLGPILLLTLRYTMQLSMALDSKGFGRNTKRTNLTEMSFKKIDYVIDFFLVILLVACLYLKYRGILEIEGLKI